MSDLPRIDPNVKHVGVSKLRKFNSTELRKLNGIAYVVQDNDEALAVLISYETFLLIQAAKVRSDLSQDEGLHLLHKKGKRRGKGSGGLRGPS